MSKRMGVRSRCRGGVILRPRLERSGSTTASTGHRATGRRSRWTSSGGRSSKRTTGDKRSRKENGTMRQNNNSSNRHGDTGMRTTRRRCRLRGHRSHRVLRHSRTTWRARTRACRQCHHRRTVSHSTWKRTTRAAGAANVSSCDRVCRTCHVRLAWAFRHALPTIPVSRLPLRLLWCTTRPCVLLHLVTYPHICCCR